jgi:S-DNA-T family DNA segregation ATPase FtsK/SpoIIIE
VSRFFARQVHKHVTSKLEDSPLLFVILGIGALIGLAVKLVRRFPRTSITFAAAGYLVASSGWWPLGELLAAAVVALGIWRWRWPDQYREIAIPVFKAWALRWFRYSRRWRKLAVRHGLVVHEPVPRGAHVHPYAAPAVVEVAELVGVRWTPAIDRLLVKIPAGLDAAAFERATDALAHATKSLECRIKTDRPGRVWVELLRRDPLTDPIKALPLPPKPRISDLAVGLREDGRPWRIPLHGTHVLGVASTGAGKSTLAQGILRALAPAIAAGLVEVWAFDPKGGMELVYAREMFAHFFAGDPEQMADALEDCVAVMRERSARLRGSTRLLEPTAAEPLRLVLIDELAALTALCDRKTAARVEKALGLLLTQGRAVGVTVAAFLQDPGKDVIAWRNLFPTRIALRLAEANEVDMVLGEGARDRGALADRIPMTLPGVGYMRLDGDPDPVRVRVAHITDDDIRNVAIAHPWPGNQPPAQARISLVKPGRLIGRQIRPDTTNRPDPAGGLA